MRLADEASDLLGVVQLILQNAPDADAMRDLELLASSLEGWQRFVQRLIEPEWRQRAP